MGIFNAEAQRTQSYGAMADLKMFTCWVHLWSRGLSPNPLRLCVFHPIAAAVNAHQAAVVPGPPQLR